MHANSLNIMSSLIEKYFQDIPLEILDLGSTIVSGQETLGSYKRYINNPKWHYTGADVKEGDNVDVVLQSDYEWQFPDNTFDAVISGQTLEHVEYPWSFLKEVARILKRGGICIIIAPAVFYEHKYPIDTFRYYSDGMRALAKWAGLEVIETKTVVDGSLSDTYLIAKK